MLEKMEISLHASRALVYHTAQAVDIMEEIHKGLKLSPDLDDYLDRFNPAILLLKIWILKARDDMLLAWPGLQQRCLSPISCLR